MRHFLYHIHLYYLNNFGQKLHSWCHVHGVYLTIYFFKFIVALYCDKSCFYYISEACRILAWLAVLEKWLLDISTTFVCLLVLGITEKCCHIKVYYCMFWYIVVYIDIFCISQYTDISYDSSKKQFSKVSNTLLLDSRYVFVLRMTAMCFTTADVVIFVCAVLSWQCK